jgi:hypothetical protein
MSIENLRIYALAFYSDLMSGIVTYELNNASEFKFVQGNIQKLQLEYLYNDIQLRTQFVVDQPKRSVLVHTSRVDPSTDSGQPKRVPQLELSYESGKINFRNDPAPHKSESAIQQVIFPVLHSGLFGQTFLSRIVEFFSEQESSVIS